MRDVTLGDLLLHLRRPGPGAGAAPRNRAAVTEEETSTWPVSTGHVAAPGRRAPRRRRSAEYDPATPG